MMWAKNYERCVKCNSTDHEHKAKGFCSACYQKEHSYPKEQCSICGKLERIHKREQNQAICSKCYKEPTHKCFFCQKIASAAIKLNTTDFVCDSCYIKYYRKKQLCSVCNHIELLAVNNDTEKVCIKCYSKQSFNNCYKCGRRVNSPYVLAGNHICNRCYENERKQRFINNIDINKHQYECSICGIQGSVERIYSDGSIICSYCFKKQPKVCSLCCNPNFKIYSHLKGIPYCRNCYYKQSFWNMLKTYKNHWSESFTNIVECYINKKAESISFETIFSKMKNIEALLNDLYLKYLNNHFSFISHSLLGLVETYPSQKLFIYDFINFLLYEGILTDWENSFVLIENLLKKVYGLPQSFQRTIIGYNETLVKRYINYRKKGWVNNYAKFKYYTCYLYLLTAFRFINFIVVVLGLQQPTQINNNVVDFYIRSKPYDKGNLRHFINYMNRNKIAFIKIIPPYSYYRHEMYLGISNDKQKQLLETCIFNKSMKLRDRIIIILMLLYGFRPEEIQKLKRKDIIISKTRNKNEVLLYYNKGKYKLPMILTSLIYEYMNKLNEIYDFIFPGRFINTPLGLSSICKIVKNFEVTSTELYYTAINNAMLNGLYQPALLIRCFGISHSAASRYYNFMKGTDNF